MERADRYHPFSNFNSIKVRLKRNYPRDGTGLYLLFQFHKGTIKTFFTKHYFVGCPLFQFHKGTIKTLSDFNAYRGYLNYFNSIKVRLKHMSGN